MKKYLYGYFGYITPYTADIPGHFLYQPFLIDESCSLLANGEEYKVDLYSYFKDPTIENSPCSEFNYFLPSVNKILNKWAVSRLNPNNGCYYHSLRSVLEKIRNREYDEVILKARFRNLSTHTKKLFDTKKFEDIAEIALARNIPVTIIDTDLSMPEEFVYRFINKQDLVRVIGLGDVTIAYPNIDRSKIISSIPLYGISIDKLKQIYMSFKDNNEEIVNKDRRKNLIYYGNIAFANYKKNHTKNREVLEYLLKLREERFFKDIAGYIIGKVEDSDYLVGYNNIKRYSRLQIADIHKRSRISVNISKMLYEKSDFTPARITESWIYGILPLSYSSGNYQNDRTVLFKNYYEFVENIRLYLVDSNIEDYYNMFMKSLKKNIDFREEEQKRNGIKI